MCHDLSHLASAQPLAHTHTEFRVNSELSGGNYCNVAQSLGPPLMAAPEGVRICARVAPVARAGRGFGALYIT